jgi:hypothetical protein
VSNGEWQLKGRGIEKSFLYDILSNKHTGIDVDKLGELGYHFYRLFIYALNIYRLLAEGFKNDKCSYSIELAKH